MLLPLVVASCCCLLLLPLVVASCCWLSACCCCSCSIIKNQLGSFIAFLCSSQLAWQPNENVHSTQTDNWHYDWIAYGLPTFPQPPLHLSLHSLLPLLSVSLMSSWLSLSLSSSAQVEHLFIMIIGLFAVSALSALWKSFFGQYLFIRAQIKTAYKFIKRQRRQSLSHCLYPSSLLPLPAAAATNGVDLFYVIL